MAIVSLTTVFNAYGSEGLGVGAIYMGVITILYNVLAVITLSRTTQKRTAYLCKPKVSWLKSSKPTDHRFGVCLRL